MNRYCYFLSIGRMLNMTLAMTICCLAVPGTLSSENQQNLRNSHQSDSQHDPFPRRPPSPSAIRVPSPLLKPSFFFILVHGFRMNSEDIVRVILFADWKLIADHTLVILFSIARNFWTLPSRKRFLFSLRKCHGLAWRRLAERWLEAWTVGNTNK